MDWKQVLGAVDEDYLVGISNKGIVKRAYKDKEEAAETPVVDFASGEDILQISVGGENVKICFPLGESKCTCPSRSICRHVILGILYAREQAGPEAGRVEETEETVSTEADREDSAQQTEEAPQIAVSESFWEEIFAYPRKKLLRALGMRGLSSLVEHMERQVLPKIQETSIITVRLPEERAVVKLLSPLEYSTCTCHKKELCAHKAEAVLWCQWQKKKLTLGELKEELDQAPEFDREQIENVTGQIKRYLEELLQMGLCRSSTEVVNTLERMAVLAHNGALPRIENNLRSMAEVYGRYIRRSASFSVVNARRQLVNLYKSVCKLARANSNTEISRLAGEFHAEYKPAGNLVLVGVTLEHFVSQSGYEGDTVYFLEEHTGQWYTYTNARPTFYDNVRKRIYTEKARAPWGLSTIAVEDMVNLKLRLKNVKADETGRLSSTRETQAEVMETRELTQELLKKWYYRDFGAAFEEQVEMAFEEETANARRGQELVFLQPARRETAVFDKIEQVLKLPLYDEKGRKIQVEVPYSKKEKDTIHYLERLKDNRAACFVGRLYLKGSTLCMYPLDLLWEKDLPWGWEEKKICSLFGNKGSDVAEERKVDTTSQDRIAEFLDEAEVVLGDLYQVGFAMVQESILQHLRELGETASDYGMNGLGQYLMGIERRLAGLRHQMVKSEEETQFIFNEYLQICDYIDTGQKKVMYDRAKLYYNEDLLYGRKME